MRLKVLIVLVLMSSGCVSDVKNTQAMAGEERMVMPAKPADENKPSITVFETDMQAYRSQEKMNITVGVESSVAEENATLRVYGIYSGRNRLDITREIKLRGGVNRLYYEYITPSCFGCAGISPGPYNMTAELYVEDQLMDSEMTSIEMIG